MDSRRRFCKLVGGLLAVGTYELEADPFLTARRNGSEMDTSTVIDPGSVWEIQKSVDQGKTWVTVPGDAIIVDSTHIQWKIQIPPDEQVAIFRLRQVITATMMVVGTNYQFTSNGGSLFTSMSVLPGLSVESRSYGFGQFVTALNGIAKGGGKNWILFVNGTGATVGSSSYIPHPGDKIEWRLV